MKELECGVVLVGGLEVRGGDRDAWGVGGE